MIRRAQLPIRSPGNPFTILLAAILILVFNAPALGQGTKIKVEKNITASEVEPGDEFNVTVTLHGYSEQLPQVLPLDAVLIFEKPLSLEDEKIQGTRKAAQRFIHLAEKEWEKGIPGAIRIGLVSFASQGEIVSPLNDDYENLQNSAASLSSLPAAEGVQMAEGMRKAQELLSSSAATIRAVVLLSASPTSFADERALERLENVLRDAQMEGIRYYTVSLGRDATPELLYMIADCTGGNHYQVADSNSLEAVYSDIFAHAAHTVTASQVVLKEQVDLFNFEIVPNSWGFSEGMLMPSSLQLLRFGQTGEITIPLGQIPLTKKRTFAYRLRARECLPPERPQESILIWPGLPSSEVSFRYSQEMYQNPIASPAMRCFKLSSLYCRKDFDEMKGEVVLTLQSNYRPSAMIDNSVRDLRIYEFPSYQYQYEVGSAYPPVERFIPGLQTDLLYWSIPKLLPQEKVELRFKVGLCAYQPRDSNLLRLNAERKPEGIEGWAEFTLPGNKPQKILLPQKYRYMPALEIVPGGRPDLFITPPLDWEKFFGRVPEEIDVRHVVIPPEGLAALWPFPQNVFAGQETPDIWVDSEKNGFVTFWEPAIDRQVVAHIKAHMQNVIEDSAAGSFQGIQGQGDLFHRQQKNRIYIRIHNVGEGKSQPLKDGLKLSAFNFKTNEWELLQAADLPALDAGLSSSRTMYIELPGGVLKEGCLKPWGSAQNVWTAILRVSLTPSPSEKHTNNNTATEKIFVVD
ncbi:MAG: VWA domain-containing protein [Deltaproteobacteria bacterium]|nr:VWA domain-containing protein [Deltaproteobacteria bacterium]